MFTSPATKILHPWKNKVFDEQKVMCTATLNKNRQFVWAMSIVSNIICAITDWMHCCVSSNIINCCAMLFPQIEMLLIQCYNSTISLSFKCWSCHASNVVHQLSSFCTLCFAIFADEVVLLVFVLQTFSWNHSPIHFVWSPLSSVETFRSICVTLCCKRYTARHRT